MRRTDYIAKKLKSLVFAFVAPRDTNFDFLHALLYTTDNPNKRQQQQ
jgi:hypothetical protein